MSLSEPALYRQDGTWRGYLPGKALQEMLLTGYYSAVCCCCVLGTT